MQAASELLLFANAGVDKKKDVCGIIKEELETLTGSTEVDNAEAVLEVVLREQCQTIPA